MSDVKDKIFNILQNLPDDVSYDDVLDAIRLQKQVMEGISQLDENQYFTHDEIKEMMKLHKLGQKI